MERGNADNTLSIEEIRELWSKTYNEMGKPDWEATEKVAQNKSDSNKRERRMQVMLNFSLFCCLFAGISCINLLSFIG